MWIYFTLFHFISLIVYSLWQIHSTRKGWTWRSLIHAHRFTRLHVLLSAASFSCLWNLIRFYSPDVFFSACVVLSKRWSLLIVSDSDKISMCPLSLPGGRWRADVFWRSCWTGRTILQQIRESCRETWRRWVQVGVLTRRPEGASCSLCWSFNDFMEL